MVLGMDRWADWSWPTIHCKAIVLYVPHHTLLICFLQSFVPTIIFTAIVPRFLAIYQTRAQKLTQWENHKHQSSFDTSLTIKTFALSSVVAYLGLALSAFIYIPFGETVMNIVQHSITTCTTPPLLPLLSFIQGGHAFFVCDTGAASAKLDRSRLQSQMFAFMVTNQATNFFLEVCLPFLTRAFASVRSGKFRLSSASCKRRQLEEKACRV